MNQYTNPWTAEAIVEFCRLYRSGITFTDIAAELVKLGYAVTRNACIGRAHRMQLKPRRTEGPPRPKPPPRPKVMHTKHPPRARMKVATPPPPQRRGNTIHDLDATTCRWPLGQTYARPPFNYCCETVMPGAPYCQHHYFIAHPGYQLEQRRERTP